MGDRLKLSFNIPPSINNDYVKPRARIIRGKPVASMYETQKAKKFKSNLKSLILRECEKQSFNRVDGKYVMVEWTFYFPKTNMDTNNFYKVVLDSITETGAVWEDDNLSMNTDKNIFYDSENPHVEIELYYLDKCGVFDNDYHLQEFVDLNCSKCKRGSKIGQKGGCSIYRKALENRMQEEINLNDLVCNKIKF